MTASEDKLKTEDQPVDDGTMSLTAHLEELRSRIIKSLLAIVAGSGVSYFFLDEITNFITCSLAKLFSHI